MLNGVAHFLSGFLQRSFDQSLTVDAAEKAEFVAIAFLEQQKNRSKDFSLPRRPEG
jgi:hypothetical protein